MIVGAGGVPEGLQSFFSGCFLATALRSSAESLSHLGVAKKLGRLGGAHDMIAGGGGVPMGSAIIFSVGPCSWSSCCFLANAFGNSREPGKLLGGTVYRK